MHIINNIRMKHSFFQRTVIARTALVLLVVAAAFFSTNRVAQAACKANTTPFQVITRDANGVLQAGINFVIYQQLSNPDGGFYFGTSILGSGKTDTGGQSAILCVSSSKAPYGVKIYETNSTYGYFTIWDAEISTIGSTRTVDYRMSSLNVIMRNAEGKVIKNAKFDIYQQSFDVDGQPIIDETKLYQDKLISSGLTTGDYGAHNTLLAAGHYVIRVHATGGQKYFYLWNQVIDSGAITTLDYKLSTLRSILEDGYGKLLKNQTLSIYQQSYDVRDNPIVGDLVASNLNTGSTGAVDVYVPAGDYALKIKSTYSNGFFYKWKVTAVDQQLTTTTYRLSGFRIILRNTTGALATNATFSIGTQVIDALGRPAIGTTILSNVSTGSLGYADVYLPHNTYVLIYNSKKLYQLDVNENRFTKIDWPRLVLLRPRTEVELSNPFANKNLTLRTRSMPTVRLAKFSRSVSNAYRVSATSITKPYTITFYYTKAALDKKKTTADKIRIAFYNDRTKKWQYVGKNYPTKNRASVATTATGTYVLIAVK